MSTTEVPARFLDGSRPSNRSARTRHSLDIFEHLWSVNAAFGPVSLRLPLSKSRGSNLVPALLQSAACTGDKGRRSPRSARPRAPRRPCASPSSRRGAARAAPPPRVRAVSLWIRSPGRLETGTVLRHALALTLRPGARALHLWPWRNSSITRNSTSLPAM